MLENSLLCYACEGGHPENLMRSWNPAFAHRRQHKADKPQPKSKSARKDAETQGTRKVLKENMYRLDIWVERKVIVDVKSVEAVLPVFKKQVLTYEFSRLEFGVQNFSFTVLCSSSAQS
jgi:hypothetical protein